jgi:hypothetical protein
VEITTGKLFCPEKTVAPANFESPSPAMPSEVFVRNERRDVAVMAIKF